MDQDERIQVLEDVAVGMTLDQLSPGETGMIARVDCSTRLGRRLLELGLMPGKRVRLLRNAFLGDPIEVQVEDTCLSLRRYEAALVRLTRED